jgi:transposase
VEPTLWTFVDTVGVEPTNNAAERVLRQAVLWRKKSFGSRSPAGSKYVERILTVVASCRLQGRNVLEYLTAACHAALKHGTVPSLLPENLDTVSA